MFVYVLMAMSARSTPPTLILLSVILLSYDVATFLIKQSNSTVFTRSLPSSRLHILTYFNPGKLYKGDTDVTSILYMSKLRPSEIKSLAVEVEFELGHRGSASPADIMVTEEGGAWSRWCGDSLECGFEHSLPIPHPHIRWR